MPGSEVDESVVLEMLANGKTPLDIAYALQANVWRIRSVIRESGTRFRCGRKPVVKVDPLEMVRQGKSIQQISVELGVSYSAVQRALQQRRQELRLAAKRERSGDGSSVTSV